MYECEHCGCRKTTLSGAPTYELRRTSTGAEVVGERRWIFDTCSICHNVRFFRQLEEDDEAALAEPHKSDAAEEHEGLHGGGDGGWTDFQGRNRAQSSEPGDGFGDVQDLLVPVMQRVKMLGGAKAKEVLSSSRQRVCGGAINQSRVRSRI
ncbi:GL15813 [Drosophila persimilis]|uniref:GL15813 n=1 Tax=Drosophila persimilis TaxID=7234 RepID=B4H143_DROPE|nr:GL15813 [Drosophila persimilis]